MGRKERVVISEGYDPRVGRTVFGEVREERVKTEERYLGRSSGFCREGRKAGGTMSELEASSNPLAVPSFPLSSPPLSRPKLFLRQINTTSTREHAPPYIPQASR